MYRGYTVYSIVYILLIYVVVGSPKCHHLLRLGQHSASFASKLFFKEISRCSHFIRNLDWNIHDATEMVKRIKVSV